MRLETFLEKFEVFADAPNAVAQMRDLFIHFAVTGKLVPHDLREEPVRLRLSDATDDFLSMPANWRSGYLGDVFTFEYGENLPAPNRTQSGEFPVYGSNGIVGTHIACLTREPSIIVGRKGSAGALNIASGPSWTTDVAYFVRPPADVDLRFTFYLFSTLHLDELGKGIKPGLSRKEAYGLPITIPPLAEQKRIVAKVDELMVLCDRLEAQQQERRARHTTLAHASLSRFAEAPTPANLDFLFHEAYDIDPADLRKSILTLAIQGKLVRQDSDDEPAQELVGRIQRERLRLVKEGRPGKSADYLPISEGMCSHVLPETWAWVPLGSVAFIRTGKLDANASSKDGQYPFFTCARDPLRIDRYAYDIECVLLAGNGNFDVNYYDGKFEAYQRTYIIEGISREMIDGRYLFRFTQIYADTLREMSIGGVISYIKIGFLTGAPFPLPPLAEQRRIVAKVDQLMALVDQLEAQLVSSRTAAANLLEAVVAELTALN